MYKARLVAMGHTQVQGVDYTETYAPVVRRDSIRMVLHWAAAKDMLISHLDVKTAFLNGILEEEVYMGMPFLVDGPAGAVLRLKKSIYGLKQAPRVWNITMSKSLKELGFKALQSDPCVFIRREGPVETILTLYVDDLLVACSNETAMKRVKRELQSKYRMTDLIRRRFRRT